jgi:hypothetical protein
MKSEFYRRTKAAFFSYSSRDEGLAQSLVDWLGACAGLEVWHDRKDIVAGERPASTLEQQVRSCRAYVLLLTPESLKSRWVALEHDAARQQSAEHAAFRRIALVTPDVDPTLLPRPLQELTRIQLPRPELDGPSAAKLLASLRADAGPAFTEDDVFVTRTWRQGEAAAPFADRACAWLVEKAGYRLVGDEPRNDDDPERLRNIISSCAAYVALVPPREPADLTYLLRDLQIAQACGMPVLVVADPKVLALEAQGQLRSADGSAVRFDGALRVIAAPMEDAAPDPAPFVLLESVLQDAAQRRARQRSSYAVFYATEPQRLSAAEREDIRRVVGGITGRPCIFPDDIEGSAADERTLQAIDGAVATIADVSAAHADAWVLAGAARASRRPVSLLSEDPAVALPGLFSGYRLRRYRSHAERVGLVHAAVYRHRRLFLNREVLPWT